MKLRDFRVGLRLLLQEPAYSIVVILGLSVGFAVCFLLLGLVRQALSYDQYLPASEHTYFVKAKRNFFPTPQWSERTPLVLQSALAGSGLPLTVSSVLPLPVSVRVGDQTQALEVISVDAEFEQLFGVRAIEGDLKSSLARPDALALTATTARKVFGDVHALGKRLHIEGQPYEVAAILADPRSNTTMHYAAIAGNKTLIMPAEARSGLFDNWGRAGGRIYFNTGGKVAPETVARLLQQRADGSPLMSQLPEGARQMLGGQPALEVRVGALHGAYFDADLQGTANGGRHGNAQTTAALAIVALLILVLAATNYVNLATVRTIRRQREIGVRKALGAGVSQLVKLFLIESTAVALAATTLGLALAWMLSGRFADLVNRPLDDLFSPVALAVTVLLGLAVGLLAGAYPAWIAVGVRASSALAGRGSSESRLGLWLRRGLTVAQFATAIGLTAVSLAISMQTRYAARIDPGFDPAPLLVFDLPNKMAPGSSDALRDALKRAPGVAAVATSGQAIGRDHYDNLTEAQHAGGAGVALDVKAVSHGFFAAYGITPLAGRLFDEKNDNEANSEVVVLNSAAALALGFRTAQQAVGQELQRPGQPSLRIIGIAPDIRYQTARDPLLPIMYYADPDRTVMTVRASGDADVVYQAIETAWRQYFPNDALSIHRAGNFFADNYADDLRLSQLLAGAAVIAVLIAAFGIYVLSAYNVQRLARQVVIRKLYGASRAAIARLIGREFLVLVGVSAVVGVPVAALAIERYMAGFVDRAPVGMGILVISLAATVVVALAASLRHTLLAINLPPALVMRMRA